MFIQSGRSGLQIGTLVASVGAGPSVGCLLCCKSAYPKHSSSRNKNRETNPIHDHLHLLCELFLDQSFHLLGDDLHLCHPVPFCSFQLFYFSLQLEFSLQQIFPTLKLKTALRFFLTATILPLLARIRPFSVFPTLLRFQTIPIEVCWCGKFGLIFTWYDIRVCFNSVRILSNNKPFSFN